MKRDGIDMAYLPPDSYIITQGGSRIGATFENYTFQAAKAQ